MNRYMYMIKDEDNNFGTSIYYTKIDAQTVCSMLNQVSNSNYKVVKVRITTKFEEVK